MNQTLSQPTTARILEGKIAMVVGASQGIGAAMAREFAAAGAKVVLAARSTDKLERLAGEIGADNAFAVTCDISSEDDVRALIERSVDRFGRLDVAVNNAMGGGHRPKPLHEVSTEEFDSSYAVNLRGYFMAMKYEIGAMLNAGGGSIVNISSTAGVNGWPGLTAYSAMKHAIGGLTKIAALDYAERGIRVNTVVPGSIESEQTAGLPEDKKRMIREGNPMKRIGTVEEVARLTAWLLSDQAPFITGASFVIDGGQLARI
jgi:NAD(P)-dependent dehydrogenase (short-subunit alcohol dehydrogenase family)